MMNKRGAGDSFRNLVIGFLLFGLVTVLLVSIIYEMGTNYGVSSESMQEATQGSLDTSGLESDLNSSPESTQNFRERFESGDVDNVDDASGVFQVAGDIIGVITTPFNVLARVGKNLLGIPEIFTKVMLAILNIILLMGLWRVLRVGD